MPGFKMMKPKKLQRKLKKVARKTARRIRKCKP